ncbi:hypothetical protein [Alienimonas sp. DA493]|uniref:hypothetical protein n=1 Tax=Alienimonas sp. DA493 TaxID=3373605 RepID=UPI003754CA4B
MPDPTDYDLAILQAGPSGVTLTRKAEPGETGTDVAFRFADAAELDDFVRQLRAAGREAFGTVSPPSAEGPEPLNAAKLRYLQTLMVDLGRFSEAADIRWLLDAAEERDRLREVQQAALEFSEADDSAEWDEGAPIFRLAANNDRLSAEVRRLRALCGEAGNFLDATDVPEADEEELCELSGQLWKAGRGEPFVIPGEGDTP